MQIDSSRITEQKAEVVSWLRFCQLNPDLAPDPFYERTPLLTPEVIDNVIESIEVYLTSEITKSPDYHYSHQPVNRETHTLIPPQFDIRSPAWKLAMVQGLDRIYQQYKKLEGQPTLEPTPATDTYYYC